MLAIVEGVSICPILIPWWQRAEIAHFTCNLYNAECWMCAVCRVPCINCNQQSVTLYAITEPLLMMVKTVCACVQTRQWVSSLLKPKARSAKALFIIRNTCFLQNSTLTECVYMRMRTLVSSLIPVLILFRTQCSHEKRGYSSSVQLWFLNISANVFCTNKKWMRCLYVTVSWFLLEDSRLSRFLKWVHVYMWNTTRTLVHIVTD